MSNFDEILGVAQSKGQPDETEQPKTTAKKKTTKKATRKRAQPSTTKTEPKTKANKQSALDKIMESSAQERMIRITVDLEESKHRKLSMLCAKSGKTKAHIIRLLLDDLLNDVEE